MYYGNTFKSIQELSQKIEEYIYWYNNHRIKAKLKGLSPVDYGRETLITGVVIIKWTNILEKNERGLRYEKNIYKGF